MAHQGKNRNSPPEKRGIFLPSLPTPSTQGAPRRGGLSFSKIQRLIDSFLSGRNERTIEAYRRDLTDFQGFLKADSPPTEPGSSCPTAMGRPTHVLSPIKAVLSTGSCLRLRSTDAWRLYAPWSSWPARWASLIGNST